MRNLLKEGLSGIGSWRGLARGVGAGLILSAILGPGLDRILVPAARAEFLPALGATELYVLVPPRADDTVQGEESLAKTAASAAEQEAVGAGVALAQEKAQVEVKKKEIEAINAKIDLAKKQKDEATKASLEADKKRQEIELKLLERRREMREAEVSWAGASKEAAQAQVAACQRERDLISQRAALASLQEPGSKATAQKVAETEAKVHELERSVLESWQNVAGKRAEAEEKVQEVMETRIKVMEAQAAALAARG